MNSLTDKIASISRESTSLFGKRYPVFADLIDRHQFSLGIDIEMAYNGLTAAAIESLDSFEEKLDFVFLGSSHSFEGCWNNLCRWFSKIRIGGFIGGCHYGDPSFNFIKTAVDSYFSRFDWSVEEKNGIWWIQRKSLPISFIIPAFNCASTISESVDSIRNGNLQKEDEIIIVNDCSSDNTSAILATIATACPQVRIINHAQNRGGASARNTAVKATKNSLIFCLDSDNILEAGSITQLKRFLITQGADIAAFRELRYFSKATDHTHHRWVFKTGVTDLADYLSGPIVPGASGNYMFTKESWSRAGGYPEGSGALDAWGFGLRQVATHSKMVVFPSGFYYHRVGHESYWVRDSKTERISSKALDILKPYLDRIDPRCVRYITGKSGRNNWFDNLDRRPLRLKSGQIGQSGWISDSAGNPINHKVRTTWIKKFKTFLINSVFVPVQNQQQAMRSKFIFMRDFRRFRQLSLRSNRNLPCSWKERKPCLGDKTSETQFDRHYIYHPAWAARILAKTMPAEHIDISSTLSFCSIVSAFLPVTFYDYRPADVRLEQLSCKSIDLCKMGLGDSSVFSLSCMHTVEHVGLGRYGDNIQPDGDLKAMSELKRVLKPGGNLLFVVPIGRPRVVFNAHRVYSYEQILSYFSDMLELKEFALISDNPKDGGVITNPSQEMLNRQEYGCGCFWFQKKGEPIK